MLQGVTVLAEIYVAVLWLLRSLLSTEMDVLVIEQVSAINALVLSNLCEYRHKSYIAETRFRGFCGYYWSVFNRIDVVDHKAIEFGEITQNTFTITFSKVIEGHRCRYHSNAQCIMGP